MIKLVDYRKKIVIDNLDSLIRELGTARKEAEKAISSAEPYAQETVEDSRYWILHYLEKAQQLLMAVREKM